MNLFERCRRELRTVIVDNDNIDLRDHERDHQRDHLHCNHAIDSHKSADLSYGSLLLMCLISITSISSTFGSDVDLKHIHRDIEKVEQRFRRFKYISSQSYINANEERTHSSSPFHQLLYNNNHRIEPYFDTSLLSTNVTVSEGSAAAYLPCRVHQLGDRTVCLTLCLSRDIRDH